jgi:aminoglycoside phosphotransferase family enzyme/predicted kinase
MSQHPQPPAESQEREIAAFLGDSATYGGSVAKVEIIETHIARVFLAGAEVYKVKKRVKLPFVDFSTPENRRRAAAREVEINRPHAPGIYLGLVPIVRRDGGRLALGGEGEIVDWAVHMRRFPEAAVLVNRALQGPLPDDLAKALAGMVVTYHRQSAIAEVREGAQAFAPIMRQLTEACGESQGDAAGARTFADRLGPAFERAAAALNSRGRAGCIRRCHGDLHLGNIVMIDGAPVPFDALEFSETLATVDVLYDLAFLLMDLEIRGDRHAANIVLNDYVNAAPVGGEVEGLACLPLFLACRAGVRAVVAMARSAQLEGKKKGEQLLSAERHVELAAAYLDPPPALLVAVGGLSGTGKSTLAAKLAPYIGAAPGALHARSDVERKRLFGVPETQRLDRQHYRIGVAQRVYGILEDKARAALAAGHSVIVDAVFAKPEERAAIEAVARDSGRPFVGLWLNAPAETLVARVEQRRGDASDADRRVVKEQLGYNLGEIAWSNVDASSTLGGTIDSAEAALAQAGFRLEKP